MSPGVTTLPVPSMIAASAGASTVAPTAAIRPSRTSTAPSRIDGPAAVITVTLRMTNGCEAGALYVDGNGSSFGRDVPPRPGGGFGLSSPFLSGSAVDELAGLEVGGAWAASTRTARPAAITAASVSCLSTCGSYVKPARSPSWGTEPSTGTDASQ